MLVGYCRCSTDSQATNALIALGKQMRDENNRHERLGLSVAEAALYDAIVSNDAAVLVMGDEVLKKIAVELVVAVQSSATIDWSLKESVRAAMRSKIRRLLAKYDYPTGLRGASSRAHPGAGRAVRDDRPRVPSNHPWFTPGRSRGAARVA